MAFFSRDVNTWVDRAEKFSKLVTGAKHLLWVAGILVAILAVIFVDNWNLRYLQAAIGWPAADERQVDDQPTDEAPQADGSDTVATLPQPTPTEQNDVPRHTAPNQSAPDQDTPASEPTVPVEAPQKDDPRVVLSHGQTAVLCDGALSLRLHQPDRAAKDRIPPVPTSAEFYRIGPETPERVTVPVGTPTLVGNCRFVIDSIDRQQSNPRMFDVRLREE